MELARIFIDILLPVFLIVGAGAVAGRLLDLDTRSLTRLVYWVVGPVFIYVVLANAEMPAALVGRLVGATLLAVVGSGIAAWLGAKVFGRPPRVVSAGVLTSVYGNVGNFGLAIVAFTFGDGALGYAGVILVVVNVTGVLVGVSAARWHEHGAASALRIAFTAPLTLAVIPAVIVNGGNIELPLWLDRPLTLVAGALIPVMLLTLGAQLGQMTKPHVSMDVVRAISVKLAIAPLLAAGAVMLVSLTGDVAGVVILQFAMPAAVFTSIIALEHDLEPDLVTTTVLVG
ncbi:MAG: AEC family transporter, partial [Actinomycetia bacterium]|nr:AEC family transporter [Actinomycetes bacterium]